MRVFVLLCYACFETIWGVGNAYARKRTEGMSHSAVKEYVSDSWIWKPTPVGFSKRDYTIRPYHFSEIVTDGMIIDLGNRELEVLLTPGHSPDSLCLIDKNNRQLFVGDTFYLAPLYAHLEGSDFKTYQQTTDRLAALAPQIDDVFTAHNIPIVKSAYLKNLQSAFKAIADGTSAFVLSDGAKEYSFDGFSVLVPAE